MPGDIMDRHRLTANAIASIALAFLFALHLIPIRTATMLAEQKGEDESDLVGKGFSLVGHVFLTRGLGIDNTTLRHADNAPTKWDQGC